MKRHAESYLTEWISSERRKPLVLRGARQVGKTTLVRDFAKNNNLDLFEINLEQFPELADVFATNNMEKIIHALEFAIEKGSFIGENKILFLDEIQATPAAIHTLRYFYENYPHIPVIAAGSLLEFALGETSLSMPVGRIEFLYIEPMTFEEFLEASEKAHLLDLIRTFNIGDDFPITAHNLLLQHLRNYILVGGMPEAVLCFLEDGFQSAQSTHASILQTYQTDFSKYATKAELLRLYKIFSYIPTGIGEKFKYVNVDPREQSRDLKVAFDLLVMARGI
ncbi:AAA family ATPase, partial [bacterium]|nr:AAA family ATPase [bacterium]